MAQSAGSYLDDIHTNGVSHGTSSNLQTPTIETLTPSISTAASRGRLSSTTGSPHSTTPAAPLNGDLCVGSDSNSIADREERAVAALLTRFKALVTLATEPVHDGATKEMAAAHGLQMEVEGSALIRATEDLLQLSRELKELWLFGPLRGIRDGEGEGQMDSDSRKAGELVEAALTRAAEHPASG
ncbi:hypothetical protein ONS95_010280 [Cadophora gregata]|uniref:uncharacterized protein n=1 Tax=Cadophora gregata TaxID=51156 RepID=UPI0026DCF29C|nr:uncharacterized protein ONS95_010280 [Cadophora gregata]KAK0122015.1 hypothetical protein ONS95_010280 [Cadophora gregata]